MQLRFNESSDIKAYRLKEARISRGYSLQEVADMLGVTKQLLSKYEIGTTKISIENCMALSELLEYPLEFFYKEKKLSDSIRNKPIYFRSLRGTSNKVKESLSQNLDFIQEFYDYFSNFIKYKKFNIPNNINNGYKIGVSDEYIESLTMKLREHWGLESTPISNLAKTLELNGAVISKIELRTHKVDAFSYLNDIGTPFIVISSDKNSAVRSRMDLAHELAHIVMHSHISKEDFEKNHKILEDEANRFASAFLLPAEHFSKDIYSVNLDSFIYLKKKWKVSIAGMVVRCYKLNLISEDQYTYLFKRISAKKWRISEPLDDVIKPEEPIMLRQSIELLVDNSIITKKELITQLAMRSAEIESMCSLEKGYLNLSDELKIPHLRLIK